MYMYILSVRSVLFLLYYTTRICVFGDSYFSYSSPLLFYFLHISRERLNVRENVGIQECQLV
jgi:hypothetical protein